MSTKNHHAALTQLVQVQRTVGHRISQTFDLEVSEGWDKEFSLSNCCANNFYLEKLHILIET